jgi:penicillin-insensitive murein endopeptidase
MTLSTVRRLLVATAIVVLLSGGAWPLEPALADTDQPVAWHLIRTPSPGPTQAIGGYAHGCLAGGIALPLDGIGYQVIRPGRHRYFGHPALLEYLQGLGQRAHRAGLGLINIGDMAQPRGGPMNTGHASHQIGLDVDVWLRLDLPLLPRTRRDDLKEVSVIDGEALRLIPSRWTSAQFTLLRLATEDSRVARIFVNPVIKMELCRQAGSDRAWLRLIRPWYGHDDHFHVRLACPPDSPLCESQAPLPPGDGCDAELASWLPEARPPAKKANPPPPPKPTLPTACTRLNMTSASLPNPNHW